MSGAGKQKEDVKVLLRNKKARHDYFVEWTVEAGVSLLGSEVKSLREAKAVMSDAYATVKNGEAWLINMQITEYPWANRWNHQPKRDRKLLLHRKEIEKLDGASSQQGYTLLPLEVYLKQGKIKVQLGVCKGKKQYDKRQDQKRKDAAREVEAALRRRDR
ncbi:MAG TPA: SsrA-binding protein SmpB [Polyangia bacterium]|jgi:SsrA-binding protein|nr:SsrA-binding protein SmpB [Polyangia bacterium]